MLLYTAVKRPSHGKLKLANLCWQTQVGVCERHKNSRQTRFYLTPTVCKGVCRLFLCRSLTPTWVCQHEFANLSLPCEGCFSASVKQKHVHQRAEKGFNKQGYGAILLIQCHFSYLRLKSS